MKALGFSAFFFFVLVACEVYSFQIGLGHNGTLVAGEFWALDMESGVLAMTTNQRE
jgi:hypothetical protein